MIFLAALPACFAAIALFSGILALPAPAPEPKNVFRPKLPYWALSRGGSVTLATPLSPPLPKFQHDIDEYGPAPPSGEYLGEDMLLSEEEPQCVHPECKCHTKHQNIEVLVTED